MPSRKLSSAGPSPAATPSRAHSPLTVAAASPVQAVSSSILPSTPASSSCASCCADEAKAVSYAPQARLKVASTSRPTPCAATPVAAPPAPPPPPPPRLLATAAPRRARAMFLSARYRGAPRGSGRQRTVGRRSSVCGAQTSGEGDSSGAMVAAMRSCCCCCCWLLLLLCPEEPCRPPSPGCCCCCSSSRSCSGGAPPAEGGIARVAAANSAGQGGSIECAIWSPSEAKAAEDAPRSSSSPSS